MLIFHPAKGDNTEISLRISKEFMTLKRWKSIVICSHLSYFSSRKIANYAVFFKHEYGLSYWFHLSVGSIGLKTSPADGDVQVQFANSCTKQNASSVSGDWTCICLHGSRVEVKYDLVHNLESLLATPQK